MNTWISLSYVTASLVAMGVIWRAVLNPVRKATRRISQFLDDWFGEEPRPGIQPRAGVMARLERLESLTNATSYQVHRNGGGSLADDVAVIKSKVADTPGG